jgi:hypothetical protein
VHADEEIALGSAPPAVPAAPDSAPAGLQLPASPSIPLATSTCLDSNGAVSQAAQRTDGSDVSTPSECGGEADVVASGQQLVGSDLATSAEPVGEAAIAAVELSDAPLEGPGNCLLQPAGATRLPHTQPAQLNLAPTMKLSYTAAVSLHGCVSLRE